MGYSYLDIVGAIDATILKDTLTKSLKKVQIENFLGKPL